MFRNLVGIAAVVGCVGSRSVHTAVCDTSKDEQRFQFDQLTGYVSIELEGTTHCAVVEGCGLAQDAVVLLVPCQDTNATCGSWSAMIPPHVSTDMPDAQWLIAPGSPSNAQRCLESPRGDTLDIYCCSGTKNCNGTYPEAIPHQQWKLPNNSTGLELAIGVCMEAAPIPLSEVLVWPLPAKLECVGERAVPLISSNVKIQMPGTTGLVATNAAERYQQLLRKAGSVDGSVMEVEVELETETESLTMNTNYSYSLSLQPASQTLHISAASPYGVAYAFESLLQLQKKRCDALDLQDEPVFKHRGLMIDTGRRFYPMPLMESILEGLAMYKMNVLHFHLSEECFRVESKVFPGLHTANCSAGGRTNNEFYTQEDIKHIVHFAKLRGIRVVPEFDMPGHSGGFCMGLASEGIQCCNSQIEDDSNGTSVALINAVLDEMVELFPDEVVHIGCDETGSKAPCTLENTKSFEEKVIEHLRKSKTVMGWEEILFKTGAAEGFEDIIVDAWARSSWQQAAQKGHPVVDSENGHFYLDNLGHDHTAAGMWLDIYKGEVNETVRSLLLGGESSMWQDLYVPNRVASCLFQSPERDDDFSNSTSSMIWPRNAIAAGSFWRYSSKVHASGDVFASVLETAHMHLQQRGVTSCACTTPTSTGCRQQAYCSQDWCSASDFMETTVV